MAGTEKVLFSRGPRATMPETKVPGTILITTDTREMFLDDTEDSRIQIGGTVDIPTELPNPYALTFTGAVTGSYDGSQAVTVEIPIGGGSGNASYEDTVIVDITIEEEVQTYRTSVLSSEAVNALKNADFIFFCANLKPPTEQTDRGTLLASIYGSYYHSTKFFYDGSKFTDVTPSSAAVGENIAESICVANKSSKKNISIH